MDKDPAMKIEIPMQDSKRLQSLLRFVEADFGPLDQRRGYGFRNVQALLELRDHLVAIEELLASGDLPEKLFAHPEFTGQVENVLDYLNTCLAPFEFAAIEDEYKRRLNNRDLVRRLKAREKRLLAKKTSDRYGEIERQIAIKDTQRRIATTTADALPERETYQPFIEPMAKNSDAPMAYGDPPASQSNGGRRP
jgi:hypothetical protein